MWLFILLEQLSLTLYISKALPILASYWTRQRNCRVKGAGQILALSRNSEFYWSGPKGFQYCENLQIKTESSRLHRIIELSNFFDWL
jgi:hypothetical protein